ncbi:reverse transcriptase domain-containing protein [Tanacetum coccineum]
MHTRASNYELVEPLPEPERTLNRRLRRQNRRVPYDQRNNPPQHPRIVYPPILNINHFRHFLDILRNYDPIDDEPMRATDRVVAPTPGSAITIPETANEFAIKDTENEVVCLMMFPLSLTREAKTWLDEFNKGTIETWDELRTAFISRLFPPALFNRLLGEIRTFSQHENESLTDAWLRIKEMLKNCHGHNLSKGNIIKIFYHGLNEITQEVLNAVTGGIFLYKTPNQAYQLLEDKVLLKLDWAKNQKTKSSLKKTIAFADEGNSNSDSDKIMARMDAMTIKMDAQYKKLQASAKQPTPDLDDDDIPMSREEEAKFMQTFLIDAYGADALRLYIINSPVVLTQPLHFKEKGVYGVVSYLFVRWQRIFTKGQKSSQDRARDWKEHKKLKSKSKLKSQSQSQQVKDEAESEEILNGPTRTHLMGRVKDVLLPWYNAYRFLVHNANRLATFDPLNPDTLLNSANVLDQWIILATQSLVHFVR